MKDELFEKLAAIEHERWAHWQKYMHSQGSREPTIVSTGDLVIPSVLVEQWERQIATTYADLTEKEKDSDREQVHRYWGLVESVLKDCAFYKSCALSGEVPEDGSEPSSKDLAKVDDN